MDNANAASRPLKTPNHKLVEYNKLKDGMLTGDLLQWKKNTLLRWIYRKLIGSDADHSSLIIRLKQYEGDIDPNEGIIDPIRRYIMEETCSKGATLSRLSRRLDGYDGEVWLYRLKKDWTHKERKEIGRVLLEHVGTPYDTWAVVKNFFFNIWRRISTNTRFVWKVDDRKLFCSGYCYLAYTSVRRKLPVKEEPMMIFTGPPHPMDLPKFDIFEKPIKLYPSPNST